MALSRLSESPTNLELALPGYHNVVNIDSAVGNLKLFMNVLRAMQYLTRTISGSIKVSF